MLLKLPKVFRFVKLRLMFGGPRLPARGLPPVLSREAWEWAIVIQGQNSDPVGQNSDPGGQNVLVVVVNIFSVVKYFRVVKVGHLSIWWDLK